METGYLVRYGTTGEAHELIQIECEVMASSEEGAIEKADKACLKLIEDSEKGADWWTIKATLPPVGARRLGYPIREEVISWFRMIGEKWKRIETVRL